MAIVIMNTMQLLHGISYAENMGGTPQVVAKYVQHFHICFRKWYASRNKDMFTEAEKSPKARAG